MFLQKNNPLAPPLEFGAISKEDLLNIGTDSICYMKSGHAGEVRIYGANGLLLDQESNISDAQSEVRSKNLTCVTLH